MSRVPIRIGLSAPPQEAIDGAFPVEISSSVPLATWPLAAVLVSGGRVSDLVTLVDGRRWSVVVRPTRAGVISIGMDATQLQPIDGSDRPFHSLHLFLRFHRAATATITGPAPLIDGEATITIDWSRPVVGFDLSVLRTDDLDLQGFQQIGPTTWQVTAIPRHEPAEVGIAIPIGAVVDDLGIPCAATLWQSYAIGPAPLAVRPVLESVRAASDGTFIATFGYQNDNPARTVRIPIGADNRFVPGPLDQGQPETFLPGRQVAVFEVPFEGGNLVWSLRSPNGRSGTATASPPS